MAIILIRKAAQESPGMNVPRLYRVGSNWLFYRGVGMQIFNFVAKHTSGCLSSIGVRCGPSKCHKTARPRRLHSSVSFLPTGTPCCGQPRYDDAPKPLDHLFPFQNFSTKTPEAKQLSLFSSLTLSLSTIPQTIWFYTPRFCSSPLISSFNSIAFFLRTFHGALGSRGPAWACKNCDREIIKFQRGPLIAPVAAS